MNRRMLGSGALAAAFMVAVGCSEGPKIIPPKVENTNLPSAASSGGGPAPKQAQPEENPNAPKAGSANIN
jgi:hypothetical protein